MGLIKAGALTDAAPALKAMRIYYQADEHDQPQGQEHNQAGLLPPDFSEEFQGVCRHLRSMFAVCPLQPA